VGKMELKYLSQFRDRHGTLRYYFRIKGRRYPLPAPGSPTFAEEYAALLAEHAPRAAIIRQGRGHQTSHAIGRSPTIKISVADLASTW
jgi:hypothetical protein